jgi:hypothetical protein
MTNAYVPTLRRMLSERPLVRGQVTMEYEALAAALAWHEGLERAEATLAAVRTWANQWAVHETFKAKKGELLALLDAAPKETP